MASFSIDAQDRFKLHKFAQTLSLKVAQVVVQSRQGKKISQDIVGDNLLTQNNLQWFNLSIPDVPEVNIDAKKVLNGEVIEALHNVLCIEIFLHTNEGDEMVLEMWTVKMTPTCASSVESVSTIYYRMSIMLKSTLSISRITPAYKMSRCQNNDSTYKISYKIYGGQPNTSLLGENHKTIKVSELDTPIGTIQIQVGYRTKMAILPEDKKVTHKKLVQDNLSVDCPLNSEKRSMDLTKPLTAGAFVNAEQMRELHQQLEELLPVPRCALRNRPPVSIVAPPASASSGSDEKPCSSRPAVRLESASSSSTEKPCSSRQVDAAEALCSRSKTAALVNRSASNPIEIPKMRDLQKYARLMEFSFADVNSPVADLAMFYQDCYKAKEYSKELERDIGVEEDSISEQLEMFEEEGAEFDEFVASILNQSEGDN